MVTAVTESGRSAKRARRSGRVTADIRDFYAFPEAVEEPRPFRDAVRSFLSSYARVTFPPSSLFSSLMTWQILLRVGDLTDGSDLSPVVVSLDVVEEDVTRSSRSVYCDHCRVVGWSGHPVCRKRYHFIIRSTNSKNSDGFQKCCSSCGNNLNLTDSSCKWCNSAVTADDVEDWVHAQFEDSNHLLYGLVHSNGYGHLLNVNGRDGGSKFLSGCSIVDFWDRLCRRLAVRMVTVMDVSRKYGLDYRLLHAVAKGHTWYGNWGYGFKSGSYALTQDAYNNALDTLSRMPLHPFLFEGRNPRTRLQNTITFYQSMSESKLLTFKELFSYLLRLIDEVHWSTSKGHKKLKTIPSTALCSWTRNDVEQVQQVMAKILSAAAGDDGWVTRHALKGVTRKAASPELLDYCLKHLGGTSERTGKIVQSRYNSVKNDLEFRLQPLSVCCGLSLERNYPSIDQIKQDLKFLYESLLHPGTLVKQMSQAASERIMEAVRNILDCKQFVKDYKLNPKIPFAINLWCHIELSDQFKDNPAPPSELLVLPMNATVKDLKNEATKAFQDVYAMFKRFEVERLLEYGAIDESLTLKFLVGTTGSVKVKGRCFSKHGLLRYRMERGTEDWEVDCTCGAKDDDGERMLACDSCGVWKHTRCVGIENSDALPSKFLCSKCVNPNSYERAKHANVNKNKASRATLSGLSCRGETATMGNHGANSRLSVTLSVG